MASGVMEKEAPSSGETRRMEAFVGVGITGVSSMVSLEVDAEEDVLLFSPDWQAARTKDIDANPKTMSLF